MGILNVTPDSFSDGGLYLDTAQALDHARRMVADGADLIDIGGESTRPGAVPVAEDEEMARVIGITQTLAGEGVAVSVDTRKPAVMRAAIAAGAAMINDVSALTSPGALEACVQGGVGVCLMHMQGDPASMQQAPAYADVVRDVRDFLLGRADACIAAGMARERIVLDPGFGFGKTLAHNLAVVACASRAGRGGLSGDGGAVAQVVAGAHHRTGRHAAAAGEPRGRTCRRRARRVDRPRSRRARDGRRAESVAGDNGSA